MKKIYLLFLLAIFPLILLCQNSNEMVLDSIIGYQRNSETNEKENTYRYVYVYDANGNKTEEINYEWHLETNDWINSSRYVYVYDAKGNKTEEIRYRNSNAGEWIWTDRWIASYDSNGNQTEEIHYSWDTEKWYNTIKNVYAYDDSGNKTEHILYQWNTGTHEWTETERTCHLSCWGGRHVYNYDSIGNLVERIYFDWDTLTNEWVEPESNFFTYDSCGNLIRETGYGAGFMGTVKIRNDYNYDSLGNQTEKIENDRYRYVYSYNTNRNQTEEIKYWWDIETGVWQISSRFLYAYDTDGNKTEEIEYKKYTNFNDLSVVHGIFYTYDINGNLSEEIHNRWNSQTKEWIPLSNKVSHWSYNLLIAKTYFIDENCSDTIIVDSLLMESKNKRKNITFRNIGGDEQNRFTLDSVTGDFVFDSSDFDYETTSSYSIKVEAQIMDSTAGIISDEALIKIYVNNLNDNAPVVKDTVFVIKKNSDLRMSIGRLIVTDADGTLNQLKFSVISEIQNSPFIIDSVSGKIWVKNATLDRAKQSTYILNVQVSDGTFSDEAIVTINIENEVTSTDNFKSNSQFKIYPNPANYILQIEIPAQCQDEFEVKMINATGKVILQKTGFIEQIDVSKFQRGIYFITINIGNTIFTENVILQ